MIHIVLRFLLFPFSVIYLLITGFRNFLYNHSIWTFKPQKFDVYTISVGNLRVGGTGKTPHIEYLIKFLYKKYKIATLSRGYGRKTKGIIIAEGNATASEIGDEPKQFLTKFFPKVCVAVAEERSLAIPYILYNNASTQVILLDDCFQHRKVAPDFNILLTEYHRPFFKDYVLPMGRLREGRGGAKRAHAIIVTKCPDDIDYKKEYFRKKLAPYIHSSKVPVFFTGLRYSEPKSLFDKDLKFNSEADVFLISGIANTNLLEKYVSESFKLKEKRFFKDHHQYADADFKNIIEAFEKIESKEKCILITEKDMVKWIEKDSNVNLIAQPVFYLPIEIFFLENEKTFQQLVLKGLK